MKIDIDAKEIEPYVGMDLKEAIKLLLEENKKGEKAYINWNGKAMLYSWETADEMFMKIMGKTEKEYYEDEAEEYREFTINEKLDQARLIAENYSAVEKLVKKGWKYVYPERMTDFKEYIVQTIDSYSKKMVNYDHYLESCLDCRAKLDEIRHALKTMEAIASGMPMKKVIKVFNATILDNPGASPLKAGELVLNFSKKGPEFCEAYIAKEQQERIDNGAKPREIEPEILKAIKNRKILNEAIEATENKDEEKLRSLKKELHKIQKEIQEEEYWEDIQRTAGY